MHELLNDADLDYGSELYGAVVREPMPLLYSQQFEHAFDSNWHERFIYDRYDWDQWDAERKGYVPLRLTKGYFAYVSIEDFDYVSEYKWYANIHLYPGSEVIWNVYAATRERRSETGRKERSALYLHRVITSAGKGQLVDHVNHYGLDDRRGNLYTTAFSANNSNTRSSRRTANGSLLLPRGVHPQRNAQQQIVGYYGQIKREGKSRKSCPFKSPERAARWYQKAQRLIYGNQGWFRPERDEPEFPPLLPRDSEEPEPLMSSDRVALEWELEEIPF